ncbi:MAG: hypothetical protein GF330_11400 [Candidatus Eisenbacteria bacterium]|nr:hypothetical protein [Candidatus Eisenbacteria bacterium]
MRITHRLDCLHWILPLLLLLPGLARGADLMENGDFEQPLEGAWEETYLGDGTIERGLGFHPDGDYEVRVYKPAISGYVELSQTVPILGIDLDCSASLRLNANATGDAWTACALVIGYLDAQGAVLGETRICRMTSNCPWQSSPTLHLIEADPGVWSDHAFHIPDELEHLAGVDPLRVTALRMSLLTYNYIC